MAGLIGVGAAQATDYTYKNGSAASSIWYTDSAQRTLKGGVITWNSIPQSLGNLVQQTLTPTGTVFATQTTGEGGRWVHPSQNGLSRCRFTINFGNAATNWPITCKATT